MADHRHTGSGRVTRDNLDPERDRMRNANQPADEVNKADNLEVGSRGDQNEPLDDDMMDNVRDAPRNETGVIEGMSTFEKDADGDVGPVPGAPLDPANEAGSPISTPVAVLIALVVLVVLIAALAVVL